jgi:integrase
LSNAEREELVMRNVAKLVKVPTPRYKIGKGLTVAQAKTLLDAAKETRWYALYVTAATLGLRHGELLGLRWQDIDVERATLTVAQTVARAAGQLYVGPAKSDASEATIPLPKVTRRVLEAHRRRQDDERPAAHRWEDHDLVFPSTIGTPMEPRNLNRHFEGLRVTAGFPTSGSTTCVTPWSACCSISGRRRTWSRRSPGTRHVDITMAIYAHTNLDAMRQALDAIEWEDL